MGPFRRTAAALLAASAAGFLAGCAGIRVTRVAEPAPAAWHYWLSPCNLVQSLRHTRPVEPPASARGTRYFLPKPYILVKPRSDGGIDVEPMVLPDPSEEYAVEGWAFLATNKLAMNFEGGLLTQVVMEPATDAVAAEFVKQAAAVAKEHFDAEKKKAEEEAKDEKQRQEDLQKKRVELETAEAEADKKHLALEKAAASVATFKERKDKEHNGKDPKDWPPADQDKYYELLNAEGLADAEFRAAEAKVRRLQEEIAQLERRGPGAALRDAKRVSPFDRAMAAKEKERQDGGAAPAVAGDEAAAPAPEFPIFPGPVLFAVEVDPATLQVSLRPVTFEIPGGTLSNAAMVAGTQLSFETFVAVAPGTPPAFHWLSIVGQAPGSVARSQDRYEVRLRLQEVRVAGLNVHATPPGGAETLLAGPEKDPSPEDYWWSTGSEVVVVLGSKAYKPGKCKVTLVANDGIRLEVPVELK